MGSRYCEYHSHARRGMPSVEITSDVPRSYRRPSRFDFPVSALHEADEIHQFAAAHRILQHMTGGTKPADGHVLCQMSGEPIHRQQAAPCHAAGELRRILSEQEFADPRMNAVGADHERRIGHLSAREENLDACPVLLQSDAPRPSLTASGLMLRIAWARIACRSPRGTLVYGASRSAQPRLSRDRASSRSVPCSKGAPPARGRHLPAFQRLPEPERMQDARSVGPDWTPAPTSLSSLDCS